MPKPDNKDGAKGGKRLVWDGHSVNNAIEFDAFMIPRIEDLMDHIGGLKIWQIKMEKLNCGYRPWI